jgi:hypothetical protein
MKQQLRNLKARTGYLADETRLLATETEIHQVKVAAGACLAVALLTGVLAHGALSKFLLVLPLVVVAGTLVVALERMVAFRHKRLEAGQCGHPFCHGVVQHSANVPAGHVVCPTCKHVWPEVPDMVFHVTQRGEASSAGPAHHFM